MKNKLIIFLTIFIVILSVFGLVAKKNTTLKPFIENAEKMNSPEFTIGILPGTYAMFVADEKYKNAKKINADRNLSNNINCGEPSIIKKTIEFKKTIAENTAKKILL